MTPLDQTLDAALVRFLTFLPSLIAAVAVFIVTLTASAWLARVVASASRRRHADPELTILLQRFTRWAIIIVGTLLALEQVDFDVTSLIAGLGIAGFTIGFALQDVAKNFVAGILLLLQQPFQIDDVVEVGHFKGKVENITLRATEMQAIDGRRVIIPNGDVFVSPIINYTQSQRRRIEISTGVAYDSDLDHVIRVSEAAIEEVPGLLEDPPPKIVFSAFGASAVDLTILYWVDTEEGSERKVDVENARDAGIKAIKRAFEAEKIDMPYPTMAILTQNN